MIKSVLYNFKKYSYLLKQLIMRDFKVKYKRSVLGVLWSLLYPILMMIVMTIVFSQMFKFKMENVNFPVYLLTGLVMFNYFSEATQSAMSSIVTNFSLINKVYIPKYIFPLSKCLFVGINFLLTLIPLLLVILFTGSGETHCTINIFYLLLPYIFFCFFMFTLGISFIVSTLSVFLRDVFYIYGIVILIWNYLTPVFYSINILPESYQKYFKLNPLYIYINSTRDIILYNNMPSIEAIAACFGIGIVTLLIGIIFFRKKQDKFIYYV